MIYWFTRSVTHFEFRLLRISYAACAQTICAPHSTIPKLTYIRAVVPGHTESIMCNQCHICNSRAYNKEHVCLGVDTVAVYLVCCNVRCVRMLNDAHGVVKVLDNSVRICLAYILLFLFVSAQSSVYAHCVWLENRYNDRSCNYSIENS